MRVLSSHVDLQEVNTLFHLFSFIFALLCPGCILVHEVMRIDGLVGQPAKLDVVAGQKIGRAGLQFSGCSLIFAYMNTSSKPKKLTRAQVREGLDQVPIDHLLGKTVSRELTAKQKRFALEVAKGSTGAGAYRKAYDSKAKPVTQGNNASRLKADSRIKAEIDAYALAIEAEKYRSPAALRALVIQSLVQVVIDPDAKQATKVQAARVLGTVTEVAAFTERKEVRTITSSEDVRAKLMSELRRLTSASAVDAQVVDADADSLLAELAPAPEPDDDSSPDEPHPPATPTN
jgi:hypothetical protein